MIYEPSEDSELLKKHIKEYAHGFVLDLGTGSGIQAVEAAKYARHVLATDINPEAIEFCKKYVVPSNNNIEVRKSDLFEHITPMESFDLIIFNPPYLPEDLDEDEDSARITTGGKEGYEIIERFLSEVKPYMKPEGRVLIVFSSLTNKTKVDKLLKKQKFRFKEIDKEKVAFEELYVYLITK